MRKPLTRMSSHQCVQGKERKSCNQSVMFSCKSCALTMLDAFASIECELVASAEIQQAVAYSTCLAESFNLLSVQPVGHRSITLLRSQWLSFES